MGKVEEAIMRFIETMGYLEDPNTVGIVFYGSYLTGYSSKTSDIDLNIIKMDSKEIVRGVNIIDGYKIEYFEKSLTELYLSADVDFNNQNNALVSIIANGKIIFERGGMICALQNYINTKYSNPMPGLEEEDAKEMSFIIDNRMIKLQKAYDTNSVDFEHQYHLLIEKIRKFYHRLKGCPEIPVDKVSRIYTDYNYRLSFCKDSIPDEYFIGIYLKCIRSNGSKKEKMFFIKELYNYSIKDISVDPNNYRILIKSRNNPNNRNHEK